MRKKNNNKIPPKFNIDIKVLIEDMVKKFNQQHREANTGKVFEIKIYKGTTQDDKHTKKKGGTSSVKNRRTLKFFVIDINTRERVVLFEKSMTFDNPAELLKSPYQRILYREFLYFAFGFLGLNIEKEIKRREEQKIAAKTINPESEYPVTPKEAVEPEVDVESVLQV